MKNEIFVGTKKLLTNNQRQHQRQRRSVPNQLVLNTFQTFVVVLHPPTMVRNFQNRAKKAKINIHRADFFIMQLLKVFFGNIFEQFLL